MEKIRSKNNKIDKNQVKEKSKNRPNRRGIDIEPNEPYDCETDPLRFDPDSQPFNENKKKN